MGLRPGEHLSLQRYCHLQQRTVRAYEQLQQRATERVGKVTTASGAMHRALPCPLQVSR